MVHVVLDLSMFWRRGWNGIAASRVHWSLSREEELALSNFSLRMWPAFYQRICWRKGWLSRRIACCVTGGLPLDQASTVFPLFLFIYFFCVLFQRDSGEVLSDVSHLQCIAIGLFLMHPCQAVLSSLYCMFFVDHPYFIKWQSSLKLNIIQIHHLSLIVQE